MMNQSFLDFVMFCICVRDSKLSYRNGMTLTTPCDGSIVARAKMQARTEVTSKRSMILAILAFKEGRCCIRGIGTANESMSSKAKHVEAETFAHCQKRRDDGDDSCGDIKG